MVKYKQTLIRQIEQPSPVKILYFLLDFTDRDVVHVEYPMQK